MTKRVLVAGAAGFFGSLLVEALRERGACEAVPAGRKGATRFVDLSDRSSVDAALDGVDAAVCAAGPYQILPLTLLEACLERGMPYLDLADDRSFVSRARRLVEESAARAPVCIGWSTVPALSAAMTARAARGLSRVEAIRVHMAPGNKGARGAATVASLLASLRSRGWTRPREFRFPPPVGPRTGRLVDAPDYDLFPELFGARTVEFRAGAELRCLNWALGALAALPADWARFAGPLSAALGVFSGFGSDAGAVGVEVEGEGASGREKRTIAVVADQRGPRIAVMPAAITLERLMRGGLPSGLVPYAAWPGEGGLDAACAAFGLRLVEDAA